MPDRERSDGQRERPDGKAERPDSQTERPDGKTERPDGRGERPNGSRRAPEERSRRISFHLPPIRLPPLFPDHLELRLPVPGFRYDHAVSTGWTLVVVLAFDVLDAVLALTVAGPVDLVRTVGGLAIGIVVARRIGGLYLWEVLAVLSGYGMVTAVPTLIVLTLVRLWRDVGPNDADGSRPVQK